MPVISAQGPVDIDLGHAQCVLLVQQRNAAAQVGELLDHGADDTVTGATELGHEGDLAGYPHVAGQVLQKMLHLGSTTIGLYIGQQGGPDIAFTCLVFVNEGIGGVVLARLWGQPRLEDESAKVNVQMLHETPADQPVLAHDPRRQQRLAVEQLPGILDSTGGQHEIFRNQALTIARVIGQYDCGQVAGGLVELQVHAIAVDEHVQALGLLQGRGVLLRKTRGRAEQKAVWLEVSAVEASIQRVKSRPGRQVDDIHGSRQVACNLRIRNGPARQVANGGNGEIRGGERPATAGPMVGGAAQITQAGFPGVQLQASGCTGVQGLRVRRIFAPATFGKQYAPARCGQAQPQGDARGAGTDDADIVTVAQGLLLLIILDHGCSFRK
ncbi:hypothetical protein D3C79_600160 [compost metagenome]